MRYGLELEPPQGPRRHEIGARTTNLVAMQSRQSSLIRFQLGAGARVGLRVNGLVGAIVVFLSGLRDDALAQLRVTTFELVAPRGSWDTRLELAGICVALAAIAMPRVTLGTAGWMRSLPASRAESRRAAVVALIEAQFFSIVVCVLAILAAPLVYHAPLDPAKVVAFPVMMAAAAAFVLPVERRAGQVLALVALGLTIPGQLALDAAAIIVLSIGDRVSGGLVRFRNRKPAVHWRIGSSPVNQWMRVTVRALPAATVLGALIVPGMLVVLAYLIVLRNPDLDVATARRTVRVAGTLAIAMLAAMLASGVVRARPAWPWVRSLPWSSRQRVLGDAMLLGCALGAIPIAFAALDWRSASIVALMIPPIATGAAGAMRVAAHRQMSAGGEMMAYAVLFGAAVAIWPWTVGLVLCTTPALFALSLKRERRAIVSRWEELHHEAAGDPAWTVAS